MATTDTKAKDTAKKPRAKKPASLKIDRKRKRATAAVGKKKKTKLVIKQAKMDRLLRKTRVILRRAIKKALKGIPISHLPDKVYKKVDSAMAKNAGLPAMIETAVVAVVNDLPVVQKASQNGGTEPATRKPRKKATEKKAKKVAKVKKPRKNAKAGAPADAVE